MITLTTLSSLNDAFVLRSMLEASEIPAFIPDETICQMDWGYINAIGGVRVQVPEEFVESAKVVLEDFKGNLNHASTATVDSTSSLSEETVFPKNKLADKANEEPEPPRQTSLIGVALVLLAFAIVASLGYIVIRVQERKATLIEAIGAYDTGDYDLAITDLSREIQLGSKNAQIYYDRGAAYANRGDQNKSTADYDRGIADYTQTLEIDPSFAAAYTGRGGLYLVKNENDKAIADFDRAIQMDPQDEVAFFKRGYAYQDKHEDEKALADFDKALALNANDELAYASRGVIHDNRREFDQAIADLSQSLEIDPKEKTTYVNRARVYFEKQEFEKAAADYGEALALMPKDKEAYRDRGNTYEALNDFEKAIADYQQALLIDPDYEDVYNDFAWMLATCPKADFRDGKKAVEMATKACELSGWKEPSDWDTLAVAYAEAGDFANAVKWEKKYVESLNPKAEDWADAKKRLVLFQRHQPYHEGK